MRKDIQTNKKSLGESKMKKMEDKDIKQLKKGSRKIENEMKRYKMKK